MFTLAHLTDPHLAPLPTPHWKELIGKRGKNQLGFADVPIEQATPYAAADADMTMRLYAALAPQLAEQAKVNDISRQAMEDHDKDQKRFDRVEAANFENRMIRLLKYRMEAKKASRNRP